jgi:16S rRNA (adenine1518-N6/adenine1519-N6)-dimethyltransferase
MNLLEHTKQLCKTHNIKPARSKGQNFLIKEETYDKIIVAADLKNDDVVLEVGPGLGFLTAKLANKVKKVIAVELDDKLAEVLKTNLLAKGITNVEVVNEDIIKFSIFNFQFSNNFQLLNFQYKVVANIPYNISSLLLRKFLSAEHKPTLMVLMLQKEVAERITAVAGKMSLLAVSVQFYASPEIIQIISKENFWPVPEVDSAIVKIIPHPTLPFARGGKIKAPLLAKEGDGGGYSEKEFFRLVKIGFSAKRKMLKNNLTNGYHVENEIAANWLKQAGFNEKIRAQELSIDNWLKILEVKSGNVV